MTLAELRTTLRRYLRDEDNQWVSDLILNDVINRSYEHFARDTLLLRTSRTFTVPDTGTLDLPTNLILIARVYFNNRPVPRVSLNDLDSVYPGTWQTVTGSAPQYWAYRSPSQLVFYPKPAANSSFSILLDGYYVPAAGDPVFPPLSADTDSPKLPSAFHMALVLRGLLELALRYPESPGLQSRVQIAMSQLSAYYQAVGTHYRHPIDFANSPLLAPTPTTQEAERR